MNKLAQAARQEPMNESIQEASSDSDHLYLKKQKEDEIRMKLDQFARELSQLKQQRDEH
ncbi:MAG: hypothetical protein HQ498_05955 [Pseudohongiella sp.]|jgi:hypothetical protein|nr:hypothetical protein [Pseudohongiella sp.]